MAEALFLVWIGVQVVFILGGAILGFKRGIRGTSDLFIIFGSTLLGGACGLLVATIVTFIGLVVTSALGVWS